MVPARSPAHPSTPLPTVEAQVQPPQTLREPLYRDAHVAYSEGLWRYVGYDMSKVTAFGDSKGSYEAADRCLRNLHRAPHNRAPPDLGCDGGQNASPTHQCVLCEMLSGFIVGRGPKADPGAVLELEPASWTERAHLLDACNKIGASIIYCTELNNKVKVRRSRALDELLEAEQRRAARQLVRL